MRQVVDQKILAVGFADDDVVVAENAIHPVKLLAELICRVRDAAHPVGIEMRRPHQVAARRCANCVHDRDAAARHQFGVGQCVEVHGPAIAADQDLAVETRIDLRDGFENLLRVKPHESFAIADIAAKLVGMRLVHHLQPPGRFLDGRMLVEPVENPGERPVEALADIIGQHVMDLLGRHDTGTVEPLGDAAAIDQDDLQPLISGRGQEALELRIHAAVGVEAVLVEGDVQRVHRGQALNDACNKRLGVAAHPLGNELEVVVPPHVVFGIGSNIRVVAAIGLVGSDLVHCRDSDVDHVDPGSVGHRALLPWAWPDDGRCGAEPHAARA